MILQTKIFIVISLSIVILIFPLTVQPQLYHWTDENGVRHFSNTCPPSDAQQIEKETEIEHSHKNMEETDAEKKIKNAAPSPSSGKKSKKSTSIKKTVDTIPQSYRIFMVSVAPDPDGIRVIGRIEGRESCKRLQIEVFLHSDEGKTAKLVFIAENIKSSGSRLFDEKRNHSYGHRLARWSVGKTSFDCVDR